MSGTSVVIGLFVVLIAANLVGFLKGL